MEPTYQDTGFNFIWRLSYLYSEPQRSDIVAVQYAGEKIMLLKRVVAIEDDTIEFREGKLFLNDREINEPYLKYPSHWNMAPKIVEKSAVYVVGDNRAMAIENHFFGQTPIKRVVGKPLW